MAPTSFGKPQPTDLMNIIRSSDKELSVPTFIQLSYNVHIDIATLRFCLYSFWKPFLIDTGLSLQPRDEASHGRGIGGSQGGDRPQNPKCH